jgi:hypothetical protein
VQQAGEEELLPHFHALWLPGFWRGLQMICALEAKETYYRGKRDLYSRMILRSIVWWPVRSLCRSVLVSGFQGFDGDFTESPHAHTHAHAHAHTHARTHHTALIKRSARGARRRFAIFTHKNTSQSPPFVPSPYIAVYCCTPSVGLGSLRLGGGWSQACPALWGLEARKRGRMGAKLSHIGAVTFRARQSPDRFHVRREPTIFYSHRANFVSQHTGPCSSLLAMQLIGCAGCALGRCAPTTSLEWFPKPLCLSLSH